MKRSFTLPPENGIIKRQVKTAFFVLLLKGGGALMSVLLALVITYQIGAAEAGVYFYFTSIVMLVSVFARLGLDTWILRYYAGKRLDFTDGHLSAACGLSACASVFFCGVIWWSAVQYDTYFSLYTLLPGIILLSLHGILSRKLQADGRVIGFSIFQNLLLPSFQLIALAILPITLGESLIFVYQGALILTFGLLLFNLKQNSHWVSSKYISMSRMLRESLDAYVKALTVSTLMWFPVIVMGLVNNEEMASVVALVVRLAMVFTLIETVVHTFADRSYVKLSEYGDDAGVKRVLHKSTFYLASIGGAALLFLIFMVTYALEVIDPFLANFNSLFILALVVHFLSLSCSGATHLVMMSGWGERLISWYLILLICYAAAHLLVESITAMNVIVLHCIFLLFFRSISMVVVYRQFAFKV